jgi:hypothetical protein
MIARGCSVPGVIRTACPVPEALDAIGVDLELVAAAARAAAAWPGEQEAFLRLLGGDPYGFGTGDSGDQLRGLGDVLAVRDQGLHVGEDLLAQAS